MAGIVFAAGFDAYTDPAQIFNSSSSVNVSASIGAFGRNGTNGVRLVNGGGNPQPNGYLSKTLPTPLSTVWHAFCYKTDILPSATTRREIASFRDAGNVQCSLILLSEAPYE